MAFNNDYDESLLFDKQCRKINPNHLPLPDIMTPSLSCMMCVARGWQAL